jgi:ribosome recycling factor
MLLMMNKKNNDSGLSDGDLMKKIEQSLRELPDQLSKIQEHCGIAHVPLHCLVNLGAHLIIFLEDLKVVGKATLSTQKKNIAPSKGGISCLRLKDCATFERSLENPMQVSMVFIDKDKEKMVATCFDIYYETWGLNFMKEEKKWIATFPPLSAQRREDFVKKSKEFHQQATGAVAHCRQAIRDEIKKLKQKDSGVRLEKQLQDSIDKFNKELEQYVRKIQDRLMKL